MPLIDHFLPLFAIKLIIAVLSWMNLPTKYHSVLTVLEWSHAAGETDGPKYGSNEARLLFVQLQIKQLKIHHAT